MAYKDKAKKIQQAEKYRDILDSLQATSSLKQLVCPLYHFQDHVPG
jgi:hypothetical protein